MIRRLVIAGIAVAVAVGCQQHSLTRQHASTPALHGGTHATISKVTDGDTVHVRMDGHDQKIRLIGINTPETVKPGTPVQCGGPQASALMHQLAPVGARARVVLDPTLSSDRDKYGRLLAYVFVRGRDVNAAEVAAGWAQVNGYGRSFALERRFKRLAASAKRRGVGVWAECGGRFDKRAKR
jgi:micrococcal nuclease